MEPQFAFTIPNEKKRLYNRFAVLIFILQAAGMLIRFFYFQKPGWSLGGQIILFAIPALMLIGLLLISFRDLTKKYFIPYLVASLALSLFWAFAGPWWIAPITLLLTIFFLLAQRELTIIVSPTHIRYPSFPPRTIRWEELNNLVFKDGLLTIDFKNDQLIQYFPEAKMNLPEEKDFNEFCRRKLGRENEPF